MMEPSIMAMKLDAKDFAAHIVQVRFCKVVFPENPKNSPKITR